MATVAIAVHPSAASLPSAIRLALGRLAPIHFVDRPNLAEVLDGEIVLSLSGQPAALMALAGRRVRCFHVANLRQGPRSEKTGETVQFAIQPKLDHLLRGRRIPHWALAEKEAVSTQPGDLILASCGDLPVWVRRHSNGLELDLVSMPIPQLAQTEQVFDYLNGYHFIQLLPLLHFLREATAATGWTSPPLRACLTFDDPNLHWPSYGFLPYREVIRLARRDRFHISFATVPLDAWGLHAGAVALFRDNPEQLSLMIHGNNHTREELGQPRTAEGHARLMGQSLRRIVRLENATGLRIDRVSVPPHEALADGAPSTMLALGFEGVSVTPWSLRHYLRQRHWPPTFGLLPAELTEDGFPVLARDRLTSDCVGPAVMAAYLGRPIVLIEHHQAVADGLDLLSCAAQIVNSLGEVQWRSPQTLLRSNFLSRREGQTLWVKPYSSRISLHVPDGVSALAVALDESGASSSFNLVKPMNTAASSAIRIEPECPVPIQAGATVELVSTKLGTIDYRQLGSPGSSLAALGRRILCEARDRAATLKRRRRLI
jgi:hypothetical protein